MRPVTSPAGPEAGAPAAPLGDIHAPFLARLRRAGSNPLGFRARDILPWAATGLAILAALLVAPFLDARAAPFTERLATLGALVFLVAAPGLFLGLGKRAFLVSLTLVMGLYGLTGWAGLAFKVDDLAVVGVLLAFGIFGLSGFNLVFVLEEVVYDAHRLLPDRIRRAATLVPTVAVAALAAGLPILTEHGGLHLPALWTASLACTLLMASWWIFDLANRPAAAPLIVRELHLFVAGTLLACALADIVQYGVAAEGLIPPLIAYLALIGTWVYVSYTTLQRTHFLLRGRNAAPWAAILLGATYAIVAYGQADFLRSRTAAVQSLFQQRMGFLIAGVWLGIAFYLARSVWRGTRLLSRLPSLSPRSQAVAQGAANVAGKVLLTERRVGEATLGLLRALDSALPGGSHAGKGWELDADSLEMAPMEKDEREG